MPLFLVSGGSSSLVESLQGDATLEDLRALNARGLAAGWDIATLNAHRARMSRLKAGGVARLIGSRRALALFISDVPGDDPSVIGSGLLGRDGTQADRIERLVIANVETAIDAVAAAALARGLTLRKGATRIEGDATQVADRVRAALHECDGDGLVWGGESTVVLPARPGTGGRNTHLALTFARQLRAEEPWLLLAAGYRRHRWPDERCGCHRRCGHSRARHDCGLRCRARVA
jgi:hydroxypyruvate reductase